MKHERNLTRLLSLLLIVALLLSLTACTQPPAPSTDPAGTTLGTVPTVPTTAPTTQPTEPTTEPTIPPTEPPQPDDQLHNLEYTLTQEDIDEFYRLLDECEKLAIAGEDMDAIEEISDQLDDQLEYLYGQNSIAMIIYYNDMDKVANEERHLEVTEICTDASDAYTQAVRRIYLSETPARDMLFEGWTEKDIDMLLKYDERIAELQQRNSEIEVDYRTATSDDVKIPLYIEFIQNNNEIAQIYGYENYYTYAYDVVYERDYGIEEVELMRQLSKDYLTVALGKYLGTFNRLFNGMKPFEQNNIVSFLYNKYTTLYTDYFGKYMEVAPGNLKQETENMLNNDSLFSEEANAMAGAFTTTIGERSYCYFGPEYSSVTTVIHEAGHYYASRYADLGSIPLDLAETHSQGNEWLFLANVGNSMKKNEYSATVSYLMYNNVAMIMICLMVDEFEQKVYSTDVSAYTAADFDALMDSIVTQYFDLSYAEANITDVNAYWRAVVVEQPIYYISYAVSSVAAMDLYTIAQGDFAAAAEIYRKLCEEPIEDGGFLESISAAGLTGPFDEAFYKKLGG